MASKRKNNGFPKQGKKGVSPEKSRDAAHKATQDALEARLKAKAKEREKASKAREADYRARLRKLEKAGAYNPKGRELTRYRKSRINKDFRELEDFLNPDKFFFIPAGKRERKRAKAAEIKTTHGGFFFERGGHTRAKLVTNKKTGESVLRRSGRVKKGPSGGAVKQTSNIPLLGPDELASDKARLLERAREIGGKLKGKERLAFVITEYDNAGYSRQTWDEGQIDELFAYLEKYQKTTWAKANLFRHIEIVKTESARQWFKDHPTKPKKFGRVNAKGRNV